MSDMASFYILQRSLQVRNSSVLLLNGETRSGDVLAHHSRSFGREMIESETTHWHAMKNIIHFIYST